MIEYKVGDKVYVRRGVETGVPESMIDFSKPYTIIQKSGVSGRICTLDGNLSRFGFHEDWLVKAEEFPVPAEEPTFKIKVSDGRIKKVIFNAPATIVFWADGTKTVVKCGKGDKWDPEKGLAMACAKKLLGNEDGYHMEIAKYVKTAKKSEPPEDTEELRFIVSSSCRALPGCETCPCRRRDDGGDGDCHLIAYASREHLLGMYHSFDKAGKLWKEKSNA